MLININKIPMEDDRYYCATHRCWNLVDDEMNCCVLEIEQILCECSEEEYSSGKSYITT